MNTWSFMPRCPKCNASPDMPCAADPSRYPATCPTFEIHAAAIGYHVIADEAPDETRPKGGRGR